MELLTIKPILVLPLIIFLSVGCVSFPSQMDETTPFPGTQPANTPVPSNQSLLPTITPVVSKSVTSTVAPASATFTSTLSLASGSIGNDWSGHPVLSDDGRFVVFESNASNLVGDDTNNVSDTFVRDRMLGVTERVSVGPEGLQANGASVQAAISTDGQIVAFISEASNLVSEDTNGEFDVFVHNRKTGLTERVSIASDGTESNGNSGSPDISASGRWIVFHSRADNLIGMDNNKVTDVFIHNFATGETELISTP